LLKILQLLYLFPDKSRRIIILALASRFWLQDTAAVVGTLVELSIFMLIIRVLGGQVALDLERYVRLSKVFWWNLLGVVRGAISLAGDADNCFLLV